MPHDLGTETPPEPPVDLAGLGIDPAKLIEPGIYFSLPEDEYHSKFALSASGVKLMRSSPLDWWARSCLNPYLADVLAEETDKDYHTYGRALHKLVLEGRNAFDAAFVQPPNKADHPDALDTLSDLRAAIDTLNEGKTKAERIKKSGTKDDLIDAILAVAPTTKIWEAIAEDYARLNAGKMFLKPAVLHQVEVASAMITRDPNMKEIFTGGEPEVSVFYRCQHTGIPCKARFDYLNPDEIVDLKSFADMKMRPMDEAVTSEMNYRGYAKQAAWYLETAAYIPALIRAGRVFGNIPGDFLDRLVKHKGKRFRFVFSRKGPAPLARARWFSQELGAYELAKSKNDTAKHTFAHYLAEYGKDMWLSSEPTTEFTDDEIADWSI